MFDNLKITKIQDDDDAVGGNYSLLDTDIYTGTIKCVYLDKAQSSESVAAHIILDINGTEISDKHFITTKEGSNLDKNGKQLKGFNLINSLCELVTGLKGDPKDFEECLSRKKSKHIELYDYDAKEKVPTAKIILPDLTDAKIGIALFKATEDKKKQENGEWIVDGSKEVNKVDKFLHPTNHKTLLELLNKDTIDPSKPLWKDVWLEKNLGQVKDNTSKGGSSKSTGKLASSKPTTTTKRTSLI
jgi:hypothetical protein